MKQFSVIVFIKEKKKSDNTWCYLALFTWNRVRTNTYNGQNTNTVIWHTVILMVDLSITNSNLVNWYLLVYSWTCDNFLSGGTDRNVSFTYNNDILIEETVVYCWYYAVTALCWYRRFYLIVHYELSCFVTVMIVQFHVLFFLITVLFISDTLMHFFLKCTVINMWFVVYSTVVRWV